MKKGVLLFVSSFVVLLVFLSGCGGGGGGSAPVAVTNAQNIDSELNSAKVTIEQNSNVHYISHNTNKQWCDIYNRQYKIKVNNQYIYRMEHYFDSDNQDDFWSIDIFDRNSLEKRFSIKTTQKDYARSVAQSFEVLNKYVFVIDENNIFNVYDLDYLEVDYNGATKAIVTLNLQNKIKGSFNYTMHVKNNIIYVVGKSDIFAIDVNDVLHPFLAKYETINSLSEPTSRYIYTKDNVIDNNYLIIDQGKVAVYDISSVQDFKLLDATIDSSNYTQVRGNSYNIFMSHDNKFDVYALDSQHKLKYEKVIDLDIENFISDSYSVITPSIGNFNVTNEILVCDFNNNVSLELANKEAEGYFTRLGQMGIYDIRNINSIGHLGYINIEERVSNPTEYIDINNDSIQFCVMTSKLYQLYKYSYYLPSTTAGNNNSQSDGLYLSAKIWNGTGVYQGCPASSIATGTYSFSADAGYLSTLIYNGEDWYYDCSKMQIGQVIIDISGLNIKEPVSSNDIAKLIEYLYYYETGSTNRFRAVLDNYSDSGFSVSVIDSFDGSVELISLGDNQQSQTIDYSGEYNGTYSGYDSGTWEAVISSNGTISGHAISNQGYGTYSVSGTFDGTNAVFGNSYVTFQGTITQSRNISGTWRTSQGNTGTFSGVHQ